MKLKNISNILKSSGFKNIELDNIIESKYILKRSGGNLSQYLFSFFDKNNNEWSLISDLSIASVKNIFKAKPTKEPNGIIVVKLIKKTISLLLSNKLDLKSLGLLIKLKMIGKLYKLPLNFSKIKFQKLQT